MPDFPLKLRIGTRGSQLALWQAHHVAALAQALGVATEIVIIKTSGDLDQRSPFDQMPDKGVFVKEIEEALLEGRIDLAVHSLKDLPTQLPAGLCLAAVPQREIPFDALISRNGLPLSQLAPGALVATGSLRRQAQILALRPDLRVEPLRGNVPTRVDKIMAGEAEATLLAVAGLRRLGLAEPIAQVFTPGEMTPAMGQGALGLESRDGDNPEFFARLNHAPSRLAVDAERAFLARIGGGCRTPAGILAQAEGESGWRLTGLLATPDGRLLIRRSVSIQQADPVPHAVQLAESMLQESPPEIIALLHPH